MRSQRIALRVAPLALAYSMDPYQVSTIFRRGDRVQFHPCTDVWMRGARYGTVTGVQDVDGETVVRVKTDVSGLRVQRVTDLTLLRHTGETPGRGVMR